MLTYLTNLFAQFQAPNEIIIFLVSLFPIVELRGGIVAAKMLGVPLINAYFICLAGNMLPIPFILIFIKSIFEFLKKFSYTKRIIEKLEKSAFRKSDSIKKKQLLGLFLFVAIPLPGTGGWTGALIASLLEIPFNKAFTTILAGVATAGVIMIFISYFIPGLFGF